MGKLFFAALFALIVFSPALGVSAPVSMETFLGFDGVFSLHKWTPLNIILENRGATIKGILEVVVTSGSEFHGDVHDTTYVMDVELPTQSKKRYAFTIYIDSFIYPLIFRLKQTDRTIVAESVNLRPHYTERKLNLFLGIENVPDFSRMSLDGTRTVMMHEEFLPETWYGYDGVEVMVIDTAVIENMTDLQLIALTDWIKKGGRFITAGHLNYASFLNRRTKSLLPIHVLGYERFFEINAFEKFCGQRLISAEGFLILKVDLEAALPLVQERDTPLILQKTFGLGRIIFFAFDFDSSPFSEWSGRQAFWAKILAVKPSPEDPGVDLEEKKILSAMNSSLPMRFPRLGVVFIFLAVYVILFQTVFIRLKKKREQRRRHLVFLLILVVLFIVLSYGLFFNQNIKKDPTYTSFLHMKITSHRMIGRIQYIGGLYGLRRGTYLLDFGPSSYPIIPIRPDKPRDSILHTMTIHESDDKQVISVPLGGWSHRFIKMSDTISFRVMGDVSIEDHGLRITVENVTAYPVIDCKIYYTGRFFSFGDILPGMKRVMRLSQTEINKTPLFQPDTANSAAAQMIGDQPSRLLKKLKENLLESLLVQIHSRYQKKQTVFYMFGWIASNVIPNPLTRSGMDSEGAGLLEWELHVSSHNK